MSEQPSINITQATKKEFSFRDGTWFFFQDGTDEIVAHGSAWNGQEKIYFNEVLVSQQRNLASRSSCHNFTKNRNTYQVDLNVINLLIGKIQCKLSKNGMVIASDTLSPTSDTSYNGKFFKGVFWGMGFAAAFGFVVGILSAMLGF